VGLQIGIDPEGETDFYADSVVFTEGIAGTSNEWQQFVVEANGTDSEKATVFMMFHPDFPRQESKVWWDDAELLVVGEAEAGSSSGCGKNQDEGSQALAEFVTPQPPQADGSIVHTVKKGENLSSIAVAYYNQGYQDITVPRIKELNNLKSDIIIPGQKLTIVAAGGAAASAAEATPEPAEEEEEAEATPEEEAEEEVTPEPEVEEEEVADASTGEVCLSLFEDANSNTLQDPDELLLSGGTLTLASSTGAPENYTTDGVTEPHCFASLAPGDYIASSTTPSGYTMTTVSSWSVQVDPGAQLELTFGAAFTGEEGADTGEVEEEPSGGGGIFQNAGRVILGVSGLVVLLVAGGLAAYFLVFRRAT
jgi:LysM repeat protein